MAIENYLIGIIITTLLPSLLKVFTILRKSECMMCGCCVYKTNNDDDLSDMERGETSSKNKPKDS